MIAESAEQQADGAAGARDGAEDAEGPRALLGDRESGGEHRERGRGEQRAERALQRTTRDEHFERRRRTGERGCRGEPDEADDECALAAPEVGEAAAEQQQACERERVRRDDPLAIAVGEPEVGLSGGQRDVHHGAVEHHHELGEGHGREGPPPAGVGRDGRVGFGGSGSHACYSIRD